MKRILIAGAFALASLVPALAADLPPAAPPPPPPRAPATYMPAPPPIYSWSGFYLGINGGYGFGTSSWSVPTGTALFGGTPCTTCSTGNFSTSGFLGGGTVGFNYQWAAVVAGLEVDGDWTNLKGSSSACGAVAGVSCQTSASWLGTARGRLGYAFDRILLYATGGGAYGNEIATASGPGFSLATTSSKFGWTGGAGVEVALAPSWTAKVEYLYVSLANGNWNAPAPSTVTAAVKFQENLVRAGINYKFAF